MLYHSNKLTVSIHAPVKVRPFRGVHASVQHGFNSRTCEGATVENLCLDDALEVSIHAPVKVRQVMLFYPHALQQVSIHAPVKVRLFTHFGVRVPVGFQFTHL